MIIGGSIVLTLVVMMKGIVLFVVHCAARVTSQASVASIVMTIVMMELLG